MTQLVTIALLDEIQDGFNRHDVDGILSHFVEDCVWVMASGPTEPEGRVRHGKPEIGEVLRGRYAQIPDMRWEDIRRWIVDDSKAISEWVVKERRKAGRPLLISAATSGSFATARSRRTPTGRLLPSERGYRLTSLTPVWNQITRPMMLISSTVRS